MKYQAILSQRNAPSKLMFTLLFVLVGIFLFGVVGAIVLFIIYPDAAMTILNSSRNLEEASTMNGLKVLQLFSSIGTFVFPALLGAFLFSPSIKRYLNLYRLENPMIIIFSVFIMLFALPVINWIGYWNSNVEFPEALRFIEDWMRNMELNNQKLLEAFLAMDGVGDYAFNLLLIAVVPAVGEELLFRGVIQKEFQSWLKNNHHLAIWISAAIFSAIHMQFLGFIPRMLMGALFGYVLHWTGSLVLPILMHFVNNATALTIVYFTDLEMLPDSTEDIGVVEGQWPLVLFCSVAVASLMYFIWKKSQQKKEAV